MKFVTATIALATFFGTAPIAAANDSKSKSAKSKCGKGYACGSLSFSYTGKSGKRSTGNDGDDSEGEGGPTLSPTDSPTGLVGSPKTFPPTLVEPTQCPAGTSSCLCGTCTEGKCTYTQGAGEDKKPKRLCLVPPSGTCIGPKSDNNRLTYKFSETDIATKRLAINTADICPNGWFVSTLIGRPNQNKGVHDSIVVSSPCVNNNAEVRIDMSCSCPVGLCYTYENSYTIKGYFLDSAADTKWYYATDGCPKTTPGPANCPENDEVLV